MINNHHKEDRKFVEREFYRMGFDKDSSWRISDINKDFELCNTYPRFLIVPATFTDEDLESVAKFRYFRRIPTAVWRHIKNGCFIIRSSQPTVGWFGWFRSELDENLVQTYVNNTIHQEQQQQQQERNERQPLSLVDELADCVKISEPHELSKGTSAQTTTTTTTTATAGNSIQNGNGQQHSSTSSSSTSSSSSSSESINNDSKSPVQNLASDPTKSSDISVPTSTNDVSSSSISPTVTATTTTASPSTATTPTQPALEAPKMLIIDARSYAAAMANRAKGGGCECSEYYQRCEVQFMNLANIHSIRKSYHAIRSVCEAYSEQSNNWISFLDNSRWLHHISGLLRSALLVVDAIDTEGKSILIHCSDGWDRTPQLVALAEIMLDPYYRTFDGFRTLIQREWLDFGHKFADRCGSNPCNEDANERCPVFLQWLDCVQQLLVQYPKHFEFNSYYLDKLNRHTYSNIFGTFSYNSNQERILSRVEERMGSLWSYFDSARDKYKNESFVTSDEVLRPSFKVKDLHFWKEVYLPPVNQPNTNLQAPLVPISTTPSTTETTTTTASATPPSTNNTTAPNNLDNNKCSHDSLYMDGLTRTVCK